MERKNDGGETSKSKRKTIMTEPPPFDNEPEIEICYKSKSDEGQENVGYGSGSDSSRNDDDRDIPIWTGRNLLLTRRSQKKVIGRKRKR